MKQSLKPKKCPRENLKPTDGNITDKIKDFCSQIPEDFKQILDEDERKGNFISALIKIFGILVSTKYTNLAKVEKVLKESPQIALKLWPEQKQQ